MKVITYIFVIFGIRGLLPTNIKMCHKVTFYKFLCSIPCSNNIKYLNQMVEQVVYELDAQTINSAVGNVTRSVIICAAC